MRLHDPDGSWQIDGGVHGDVHEDRVGMHQAAGGAGLEGLPVRGQRAMVDGDELIAARRLGKHEPAGGIGRGALPGERDQDSGERCGVRGR